jgi:hypothetical protein
MGLDIYILTDLPEQHVPRQYQNYLDFGIKGWWLVPYVRTFGNFKDGCGSINISNYLKVSVPSWETVEEYVKGEYPNDYSRIWTKEDHESFVAALKYFATNDFDSYLQYDC